MRTVSTTIHPAAVTRALPGAAGLLLVLLLSACGQSSEVVVQVLDESNRPVEGVELVQLGLDQSLGRTDAQGRVTIAPQREGDEVQIGANAPAGREGEYRFRSSYTLGEDAFKNGRFFIRAEAGAGSGDAGATLRVTSEPRGAEILVNGTPMGRTNTVLTDLPAGRLEVVLQLEGMHPDTTQLFVDHGEEADFHRDLTRASVHTASLRVSSEPTGATVTLNGRRVPQSTPAVLSELEPGRYSVKISKAGYQDYATSVELRPGMVGMVDSGPLQERVTTPPARREETPTRRDEPPAGREEPPARRDTPTEERTTETRAPFEKTYKVSTSPYHAEVYVDRDPVNRNQLGSFEITLSEGQHLFRVVNERAGVNVVLKYEVERGDRNSILLLDFQNKQVRPRP